MKKKVKKTIGELTNSRGVWVVNPQTRVAPNKKAYTRKSKHKGTGE